MKKSGPRLGTAGQRAQKKDSSGRHASRAMSCGIPRDVCIRPLRFLMCSAQLQRSMRTLEQDRNDSLASSHAHGPGRRWLPYCPALVFRPCPGLVGVNGGSARIRSAGREGASARAPGHCAWGALAGGACRHAHAWRPLRSTSATAATAAPPCRERPSPLSPPVGCVASSGEALREPSRGVAIEVRPSLFSAFSARLRQRFCASASAPARLREPSL